VAASSQPLKKVLLVGAAGMLGRSIQATLQGVDLLCLDREQLDITCYGRMRSRVFDFKPDYIINCAAYTAVDQAQSEPVVAYRINSDAVRNIAQIAAQVNATLIHFSTDYVFDGNSSTPYKSTDATQPINVYGASKLQGEQAIQASMDSYYIFRISWLYAAHGRNFFRWVMENTQDSLNIVDNQIGAPTSATDLARCINHLVHQDPREFGIYHFCNKGSMSWYAFAKAISQKASLDKTINPTDQFPTAARRPKYSLLDTTLTEEVFDFKIKSIDAALDEVMQLYQSQS
jgi:dTDP-4-dehydrorhamnose reductase